MYIKKLVKFKTPILLIGFNRPDLMRQVVENVAKIKPVKIYVAVDGPRNSAEESKVNEVRQVIKLIDWKCEVKTNFQKFNLGCKFGPVAAMDWFFKNEEMGIIIEDDVLADESFYYFAEDLLNKYKNNLKIGSISGNNFQFGTNRGNGSYYFSRYSHSCGWATWRRAWKLYSVAIEDYPEKSDEVLSNNFNNYFDKLYWKLIFDGIKSGELDSAWDYQWNWMMWKNKMLGIIPNVNLVRNVGFGRTDATHTKFRSKFENLAVGKIAFPLTHPEKIKENYDADGLTQKQNYVLWKEVGMTLIRRGNMINRIIGG